MSRKTFILLPFLRALVVLVCTLSATVFLGNPVFAASHSAPHVKKISFPLHVVKQGVTNGNCGVIDFDLVYIPPSKVIAEEYVSSSDGFIASLTYTTSVVSWDHGTGQNFSDSVLVDATEWKNENVVPSIKGYITGSFKVDDVLSTGTECEGVQNDAISVP